MGLSGMLCDMRGKREAHGQRNQHRRNGMPEHRPDLHHSSHTQSKVRLLPLRVHAAIVFSYNPLH